MVVNNTENLPKVQNLFNQITLLTDIVKDRKADIKEKLENDDEYQTILEDSEVLKEQLKAINIRKKNFLEKFKEKNTELYRDLDSSKNKLEGVKERMVKQLLDDYKAEKEIAIYKEKKGKKVRMKIEVSAKFKALKKDEQNDIIDKLVG